MTAGARPLDVHRISRRSLGAIATGRADADDLRLLCSGQRSQLLLVIRTLLDRLDDVERVDGAHHGLRSAGGASAGQRAWRLLCRVEREAPDAVEAVLSDPAVMAWSLRLLRRMAGSAPPAKAPAPLWADLGQFQALAAAAALRAGVPVVVRVPAHRGMVWVPGAGVAGPVARRRWSEAEVRVGRRGAVVRGETADVRLPRTATATAPGWRPLLGVRPLPGPAAAPTDGAAAVVRLDTVTPYRDFTRYPKSPGRMGERGLRLWQDRVARAYDVLARESPDEARAVTTVVKVLVPRPFRTARGGLVASASSADAFGAVTLSLPYDATQTAAVLVHEARHQQLNALLGLVPLVRAAGDRPGEAAARLHYAPWRSDPRPVLGLLHGVFAFAGVARFWRRHRTRVTGTEALRADFEFALLREQVLEGVGALASDDDLTEAGRLFVAAVVADVRGWLGDDVHAEAGRLARHYCALRRSVWRVRHLEVERSVADGFAAAWTAGRTAPPLPPVTLRPRPDRIRLDSFGPSARYLLSSPKRFFSGYRQAEAAGDPVRLAEYATIAGDAERAALHHAAWAARAPEDAEAWIGAALALPVRGAAAEALLSRPDLIAAVRRALTARGAPTPTPLELATWLTN
ncbi:aKG-HExxH-type peptide beta-hydroxylase [Streptomyces sp. NPDC017979]|uniref:aKG-HExxH-type peptide beta-hydroxylase n=1 Tax=Streptomyces sp. NPDC017979 TaxID=3365024 RepID=UPI0037A5F80E